MGWTKLFFLPLPLTLDHCLYTSIPVYIYIYPTIPFSLLKWLDPDILSEFTVGIAERKIINWKHRREREREKKRDTGTVWKDIQQTTAPYRARYSRR